MDLKSKTAELRREHILDAAIEAFARHGYRGATIRDIASEAGVSDGTLYNVFENKEALLLSVLQRLLLASQPAGGRVSEDGEASVFLSQMFARRWDSLKPETLDMMRVVWSEALINRELAQQYLKQIVGPALNGPTPLLEELANRGELNTDDASLAVRLIVASFLGLALLQILGDEFFNEHSGHIAQPMADLLLRGILRHGASDGTT